jgi:hypothetical protein
MRSRPGIFISPEYPVLSFEVQASMTSAQPAKSTQFRVLVRHFLERFFKNDLASSDGEAQARLIQVACALGLPGLIMALYLYPAYHLPRGTRAYWGQVGDHYFYVMYSLVAMGIVTIFEWDFFFPDLLDVFVLTTLPVTNRHLFLARVAAIFVFICGFLFDSNFLAPMVLPAATEPPNLPRLLIAHVSAVAASGIFAATLFLALQGLLLGFLGEHLFRRISLWLQGIAVAVLLTLLFLYPVLFGSLDALLHARSAFVLYLPPLWFLGMYQRLLEGPAVLPIFATLAQIGCAAVFLSIALSVFSYPFAYWRRTRSLIEGATARPGRNLANSPIHRFLHAILLRSPMHRAIGHFISQTLPRVLRYRTYLVMYSGLGVALILASVVRVNIAHRQIHVALSSGGLRATIPIVAFWTISGLRAVLLSPADQRGTWIFRVIHGKPGVEPLTAARLWVLRLAAMLFLATAAMVIALAPPEFHGWRFAACQGLVATGLCLILTDALFLNVKTLPFTGKQPASPQNLALVLIRSYGFFPPLVLSTVAVEPWMEAGVAHLALMALAIASGHFCMNAISRRNIAQHVALIELDENEGEFPQKLGLRY